MKETRRRSMVTASARCQTPSSGARELVDGGEVDLALDGEHGAAVEGTELQHPEERLLLLH